MKRIYQKLWEIDCKLDELVKAFSESGIGGEESIEYSEKFMALENAYMEVIKFVAKKRGIPLYGSAPSRIGVITNEDVKRVLLE